MGVKDDVHREREAFRATLLAVGPDAPTACGSWTSTDLAVHVALGDSAKGIPAAMGRALVAASIRVGWLAPFNRRALERQRRRQDFRWAVDQLGRPVPAIQLVGPIATVSLLEVWAHHEDLLAPYPAAGRHAPVDLGPVIATLWKYHYRFVRAHDLRITYGADDGDLVRWLSGRAPLPPGVETAPGGAIDSDVRRAVLSI